MQSGSNADTLRAVGLFLDQQQAVTATVRVDETGWSLDWDDAPGLMLESSHLIALRSVARLHRGLTPPEPRPRPGRLRAIGELFDQTRASRFAISEQPEGYRVSMQVGDREGARVYRINEIEALAERQRSQRVD